MSNTLPDLDFLFKFLSMITFKSFAFYSGAKACWSDYEPPQAYKSLVNAVLVTAGRERQTSRPID